MDSSPVLAPAGTLSGQPAVLSLSRRIAAKLRGAPLISLGILTLLVFTAVFADFLAPHNPEVGNLRLKYRPPAWEARGSSEFLLGTDHMGRDVLSRIIYGSRISLIVSVSAVLVAGIIGTALGILSGYLGRWVDQVIMRITDTWLALPPVTFAILLAALLRPSKWNIVIILGVVYWTRYARVIRGEVLSLKERDYVRLAIVAGCSRLKIMWTHILPNIANSAVVLMTLQIGVVIIAEATLSFLGVGVAPPEPAWGLMASEGKAGLMTGYWWLSVFPCICIMLVVLAASSLGDWFRVWSDPQLRQL
ncbi:MAG: ABC transporter permease [candidate division KSB1 bacterium]|nr:ABC transporter permease [candidate division KSB1 bacterium]